MALTKELSMEIYIDRYGIIFQKNITSIIEDGVVLTETYHKKSFEPGSDLSNEDPRLAQHAAIAWTPNIIAAAKSRQNHKP